MAGWSSGWVAAAGDNTDASFSHNLNSTDVIWQIYVADNMEGLNASIIDMQFDVLVDPNDSLGAMMTNVTDTSFSLSLGVGYVNKAHGHEQSSFDGKFVKVVGFAATTNSVPGTGDLCSLLSADSGYQMFRNGLTMQWMSDNFIQEGSHVINFPIAFAAKPFKVVASIRHEGKMPEDTQQWMHVVNWTKDYVTVYCQSHNATEFEIGVDIIAIGIAEVVNCPNSEGSSGTKISNLKKAESLEDSDLFVVSKEVDGDTVYDTSNNVTMSSLTESIKTRIEPTIEEFSSNIAFIDPVIIYSHSGSVTFSWTTKDLSAHIPEGATGCIINITYSLNGPDDNIPAKTFLRAKNGAPVYTAIYAGAWGGGDELGGNSQGLYPINVETRSIDISIPSRSPRSQNVYLIGYF